MTPEQYIYRLTEISQKKYKLLQDMFILTGEHAKTINQEGIERLDKIIEAKQNLIEQIDKLDEEFNVYFSRLKQSLGIKSFDELKGPGFKGMEELQASVKQVMALIGEISQLDEQNNKNARILLNNLGDEIKKINQGKKVNMAYNPSPIVQPPSYFIDKKK